MNTNNAFVQIVVTWSLFAIANVAAIGWQLGERLALDYPGLWLTL